jgi:hypothetical protein
VSAHVEIINEVGRAPGEWTLCFQWVRYHYDDRRPELGYRFIWRHPDDALQPARGQARIPSAAAMFELIQSAMEEGWFITCETNRDD